MIKSVKEIKKLISKVMIPGYSFKTNFSSAEFLVDINNSLVIAVDSVKKIIKWYMNLFWIQSLLDMPK